MIAPNPPTDIKPPAATTDSGRKNLSVYLGLLLIVLGVVLTVRVLERTILPEGTLVGTTRRAAAWFMCRLLLVGIGLFLALRKPKVTVIHLAAFIVMGLVAAIFGAVILQFAFHPPPVLCGSKAFAPPAERNEIGYRGRHIQYSSNDFVIVLLGDSHVESMALTMDSMPEQRLESHLNAQGKHVKVFSIGAGGYGQDEELLALQEYFQKYRADLVVLWQTPGNDVWNNLFKTQLINRSPKPTYWLDEKGNLCGPSEALGEPLANSPIVVVSLWQRVFSLAKRDQDWERSLPEPYQPLDHYDGKANPEWQERWDTDRGRMRAENLATEKNHFAVTLAPRSKRMQYGLDLTRALLVGIQSIAVTQNAKLVIFQVDQHAFNSDEDEMYVLNGKYYRVSKRQFEENLRYVHEGFDTLIVPVTVKDWRVAPDDGHFNKAATDQLMGDLAQRLQDRIPDKH